MSMASERASKAREVMGKAAAASTAAGNGGNGVAGQTKGAAAAAAKEKKGPSTAAAAAQSSSTSSKRKETMADLGGGLMGSALGGFSKTAASKKRDFLRYERKYRRLQIRLNLA